jgi:phospholipase C
MRAGLLAARMIAAAAAIPSTSVTAAQLSDIQHVIVIYLENQSFDKLFGFFPGADGLAVAGSTKVQVDKTGRPYEFLPRPIDTMHKPPRIDPRFPDNLPNQPFSIEAYVPIGQKTGDLIHRFYEQQAQINGGRMDKFVAYSDAAGLAMGFYDGSHTRLWEYARRYTLADHFFHAAFGGSFLNHFWFVCACSPRYDNAPPAIVAKLDANGNLIEGSPDVVTPDGYAVNTIQPLQGPHSSSITDKSRLLPPQDMPTIGDRLSEKGISWAWYSGGWDDAIAGRPDKLFQFHHQAFAYFRKYSDGMEERTKHLKDAKDFIKAIGEGDLPQVAFYKPIGSLNEHPGYADVLEGDEHVGQILAAIEKSPIWSSTVVVVTFDENGGSWDHVSPPKTDRWGPGIRVPTVVVSPFAKKGFIDHTTYDTTSILKLIETRFGLAPLSERDAKVNDLTSALELTR